MKELTTALDLAQELQAVVSYLTLTWEPMTELDTLVEAVQSAAFVTGRGWLQDYKLGALACEKLTERKTLLETSLPSLCARERQIGASYDVAIQTFQAMLINSGHLVAHGKSLDGHWDYSHRVDRLHRELTSQRPSLASARPLGWAALEAGYEDYDGQEEFDSNAAYANFQGVDTQSASASAFPVRIGLPYVMYDDKCQGRSPSRVLVAAIFSHFLGIREYLNTQGALAALGAIGVPTEAQVLFDFDVPTDNPFLQALVSLQDRVYSEKEYLAAISAWREFEAKSDAEKAVVKAQNEESMRASTQRMILRLKSRDAKGPSPEEAAKEARCKDLLRAALA